MSTGNSVQEINRAFARQLMEDGLRDPQSAYAGKFVGIANGKFVVVADNWDELDRQLRQAEPDPTKTFALEAGRDYNVVYEIWTHL